MHFFERTVSGRKYRIAAQSRWDAQKKRSVARQVVLGAAGPPPIADLSQAKTVGTRAIGDMGALIWVAEQLDLIGHIDRACGDIGSKNGPSIGEMVLAVAVQRACSPGPKRDLSDFLKEGLPLLSCVPAKAFTGQAFYRLAQGVTDEALEQAQIAIAGAAVERFGISTDVLAFDTTNFDTHIASTTASELARRGHAKSKRRDRRVVGLSLLVSETGHVPLLHRTYPGNRSDQKVLAECLGGLGRLHDRLGENRSQPSTRTLVRDGGSWSPQLELDLDGEGYRTLISLPKSHDAAKEALEYAAKPKVMKKLGGDLGDMRAARIRTKVGDLDRTLLVVESPELLKGQKRGIEQTLSKARDELDKLKRAAKAGKIKRTTLEQRVATILRRDYLSHFVVVDIDGDEKRPQMDWYIDTARRKRLEKTLLGRRVLCTDQHSWSAERIVYAFRGQWKVEELFRRSKDGGIVPWGPSFQWNDASIRLHTFASVIGLMLVSLAKLAWRTSSSVKVMMKELSSIRATVICIKGKTRSRRAQYLLPPLLTPEQRKAVKLFELERWMPALSSSGTKTAAKARNPPRKAQQRGKSRHPGGATLRMSC